MTGMGIDTVILAAIAVALLARLWFVLGRRSDSDPQRPNPFVVPAPEALDGQKAQTGVAAAADGLPKLPPPLRSAPTSVAGGLEQIKAADPLFDERAFLRDARAAFTVIVGDFAKGNMSSIERQLGPKVLPHFQNAIDARVKAGESLESRIARIREAETIAAVWNEGEAKITVRFISEQENTLRDSSGKVIGGGTGQIEEITDLWTFARDTKNADAPWILVETHS